MMYEETHPGPPTFELAEFRSLGDISSSSLIARGDRSGRMLHPKLVRSTGAGRCGCK